MGTRHWPEDADEAVEKLETKIAELEATIKQLQDHKREWDKGEYTPTELMGNFLEVLDNLEKNDGI